LQSQYSLSGLRFASVSKRVIVQKSFTENEPDLHDKERAGETHFHNQIFVLVFTFNSVFCIAHGSIVLTS